MGEGAGIESRKREEQCEGNGENGLGEAVEKGDQEDMRRSERWSKKKMRSE